MEFSDVVVRHTNERNPVFLERSRERADGANKESASRMLSRSGLRYSFSLFSKNESRDPAVRLLVSDGGGLVRWRGTLLLE